jgi:hypothetical protein
MSDLSDVGAVVKSVSIDNMLNQRAAVLQRVENALGLLREARSIADAAHIGFPRLKIDENPYSLRAGLLDDDRAAEVMTEIGKLVDRFAWQHMMNESGLRTFMDARAREDWNKAIQKNDFPEFTFPNISATFRMLHSSRIDMFERGVIAVFKYLSWDYKTNRPFAFGKRIVMRGIRGYVTRSGHKWGCPKNFGYLNHGGTDALDDLVRVFSVLDGKPEPDHRNGMWSQISGADSRKEDFVDGPYFHLRWFLNGNGHLTFKRPDLVDKMNRILAKHYPGALPNDKHAEAA